MESRLKRLRLTALQDMRTTQGSGFIGFGVGSERAPTLGTQTSRVGPIMIHGQENHLAGFALIRAKDFEKRLHI